MQSAVAYSSRASVTDLAYSILKSNGRAMHYKDLIHEILRTKAIAGENQGRIIAQIHTEINLDSRFFHQGQGEWGLRDWAPRQTPRIVQVRDAENSSRTERYPRFFGELERDEDEEQGAAAYPDEESESESARDSDDSEWD